MTNEELKTLYEAGLTIREISSRSGFSYEKVRQILKSQKVKWSRNYISDLTPEQVSDIVKRFDDGESIKKISKWYELSPPAIARLLKSQNREAIPSNRKYDILRQTPINSIQKQIIVGGLLGDGCLYKDTKNSNFKYSFGHCLAQEQYFHWKVAMLDPFINTFHKSVDKRENSIMLQTATITHQGLNKFGEMFYDENRIKYVPDNLDMFLTPIALAIWIMDDGNLNMGVNMRIQSQGFTEKDNYKLRDYLYRCFGLSSKVMIYRYKDNEKKYYILTLNKENTQKLSDIIRPYVVDCLKYKLMPESSTTTCRNP
jgi:hypothetical protein